MPKIRNKLIEIKSLLNSQACGEENEICVAFCFNWNRVSNIGIKNIIYDFHVNLGKLFPEHYGDVTMGMIASQITSLTIVYSTVYSGTDQRKHQSSASLAFVWGIHRGPVNSPHKWPVTRKMFPFDDVIMDRQGDGRTDEQTDIKFSLTLVPESIPIVEYFLSIDLNFSSLRYEINLNGITVFIWWQKSLLFDTLITNHNWSECLGYEACTIPPFRISLLTLKEIQKAEIC